MLNTPWILTILPFPHCIWYFQARYLDILGTVSNCLRNDEQVLQTGAGESSKSTQRSQMRSRRNLTASRIKNGPLLDGKLSHLSSYFFHELGKSGDFTGIRPHRPIGSWKHACRCQAPAWGHKLQISFAILQKFLVDSNDSRIPNKNGTSPLPTAEKRPTSRTFCSQVPATQPSSSFRI